MDAIIFIDGFAQVAGAGLAIAGVATHHTLAWMPMIQVGDGLALGAAGRF